MEADMFGNKVLRTGIFMLVSIIVFAMVIWSLGERAKIFVKTVKYKTKFKNVSGLAIGADVSIAGYMIGNVTGIALPDDITDQNIIVEFSVEKKKSEWIRKDTRAWIKTMGLLGDKYIELTQGSISEPPLDPGSYIEAIPVVSMDEFLMKGDNMVNNIMLLTKSTRHVMEKINRGEGILGKLITDQEFSDSLADDGRKIIRGARSIVEKVDRGQGGLGVLVNDTGEAKAILENFHKFSGTLRGMGDSLDRGETLVARLFKDEEEGSQIFDDLSETASSLKKFTASMDADSFLGRLTSDDAYATEVMDNMNRFTLSLATITGKIAEGEGTIGKLVHDESLYRGMSDMVQGANNSKLTRWFLRKSQAEGQKQRKKQGKGARGPEE
jgi:phospholipid/cholesterol/gamma-HCH transport system substrate-binding protein